MQQAQWSDAVYVPGRWVAGRISTVGSNGDSLAQVARVDYFSHPPRWRAEIRRSSDGRSFAAAPDIIIGDGARIVVLTQLGATPFAQHALARDSLAQFATSGFDGSGRRRGAASGRITERVGTRVVRVVFRRAVRGGFDAALLNPGASSGSRNLIASNIRTVGDQRNASVVATAGARGVDRVNTPNGVVPVTPDSLAITRMEQYSVGTMALEEFLRGGKLGAYRDSIR